MNNHFTSHHNRHFSRISRNTEANALVFLENAEKCTTMTSLFKKQKHWWHGVTKVKRSLFHGKRQNCDV